MSDGDHSIDDDGGGLTNFFEEVKIQVKDFQKAIHNYAKAEAKTKDKMGDRADKAQKSAKEAISIFKNELKSADDSERRQFKKEFEKQEQKYQDCVTQLKELKSNKSAPAEEPKKSNSKKKDDLLGKEDTGKKNLGASDDIEMDDKEPKKKKKDKGGQKQKDRHHEDVQQVIDIQNETTSILEGMLGTAEETIQIGTAAQEKLQQQTEKMVQIQKELDDLGSDLKRARKELNAFMRGLACDHCMGKIIIAAIIILALGVVAIIVLRSVKPDIFSPQAAPTPAPTPAPTTGSPFFA